MTKVSSLLKCSQKFTSDSGREWSSMDILASGCDPQNQSNNDLLNFFLQMKHLFLQYQKQRPNVERVAACIRQHHPQYSNETVHQVYWYCTGTCVLVNHFGRIF